MAELSHPPCAGELPKTLTGIRGLDEVTRGGFREDDPRFSSGGPGSGKTLLALTFLVNGAVRFDEPGVLMTFEENEEEIANDVASLGFDLPALIEAKKLAVNYVRVERSEIEETGEYDLELEIIDLLQNPALASGDQILAVPTLVRRLPKPIKKIIGDLSNRERVLVGLDLRPR